MVFWITIWDGVLRRGDRYTLLMNKNERKEDKCMGCSNDAAVVASCGIACLAGCGASAVLTLGVGTAVLAVAGTSGGALGSVTS